METQIEGVKNIIVTTYGVQKYKCNSTNVILPKAAMQFWWKVPQNLLNLSANLVEMHCKNSRKHFQYPKLRHSKTWFLHLSRTNLLQWSPWDLVDFAASCISASDPTKFWRQWLSRVLRSFQLPMYFLFKKLITICSEFCLHS